MPAGDPVDVSLVDDPTVWVEEVERDRRAASLQRLRPVDSRGGRAVGVAEADEDLMYTVYTVSDTA